MNTSTDPTTEPPAKRRSTNTSASSGTMTEPPPAPVSDHNDADDIAAADEPPRRDPRVGPLVAFVTAAVVFAIGHLVLAPAPSVEPIGLAMPPVIAPPVAAMTAAAPPPAPVPEPAPVPAAATPEAPSSAAAGAPSAKTDAPEKDIARQAWRKNLPDLSDDPRRSSLLIPIRGSIEGATYHFIEKQKGVILTLPSAESMITMPFYRLKHDSFRTLWIQQGAGEPTSIRLMLGATVIKPEVEIRDGFARVTVTKTAPPKL